VTTTTTRPQPRPSPDGPRPAGKPRPEPAFLAEFRRLSALAPPGKWPATLPTTSRASLDPRPVALGIGERVCALLPEAEHAAFHEAIRHYTRVRPYLLALAADGAMRWSDDGGRALEPVSEEHRASATAALLSRALRELKQQRSPKPQGAG
jgi:hypothetical protein